MTDIATIRARAEARKRQAGGKRSVKDLIYENIIGRGEVDTPGERLGQLIRGGTAAVARGMADIPALPANVAELGAMGVEKALGMEEPSAVSRFVGGLPDTREMLASVPGIGPETEYVAPGRAGKFISTAGEFAGGAGAAGGARAMLRYGAIPGLASEAAGQATEGTAAEPFARIGAALATPMALSGGERAVRRAITPHPGARPANIGAAKRLEAEGVPLTAGQKIGSKKLQYAEAVDPRFQDVLSDQADDFTRAVMRRVGVDDLATPEVMAERFETLGGVFNDVAAKTNIRVDSQLSDDIARAADAYSQSVGTQAPLFRNIAAQVRSATKIGGDKYQEFVELLGPQMKSGDGATRKAAVAMKEALDDALQRYAPTGEVERLIKVRSQYRDLLAIEKAVGGAGEAAASGVISPAQLRTAVKGQGTRQYVKGERDLGELARAGVIGMKPLPQSGTQPRMSAEIARALGPIATGGGAGGTLGFLASGGNPAMAAAGVTAGMALPRIAGALRASPAGQAYLANQLVGRGPRLLDERLLNTLAAALANQGVQR